MPFGNEHCGVEAAYGGHVTLGKQDIFWNLGSITPKAVSWDTVIPQGDPITLPNTADVRDMESSSTEAWQAHNTTPHHSDIHLRRGPQPAAPITLSAKVDVEHTLPGPAVTALERDAMVLPTKSDVEIPKDLPTSWATSPIEVETQVVPTTRLVVKLASPLTPSNQAEEERWVHVGCDCFYGEAEFGNHQSYPWRHGDCLTWESGI